MQLTDYVSTVNKDQKYFWLWHNRTIVSVKYIKHTCGCVGYAAPWKSLVQRFTMLILLGSDRYRAFLDSVSTLWRPEEGFNQVFVATEHPIDVNRSDGLATKLSFPLNAWTDHQFEEAYVEELNFLFVSGYRNLQDTIYQKTLSDWFTWFGNNKPTIIIVPEHKSAALSLEKYCIQNNVSYVMVCTGGYIQDGKYYYDREN